MTSFHDETYFCLAKPFRLQWEEAQDCHVLLYPEGMIKLNSAAGSILDLCCRSGKSVRETIEALSGDFAGAEAEISADVKEFLQVAYEQRWIERRS